jgi:hypothetical protein
MGFLSQQFRAFTTFSKVDSAFDAFSWPVDSRDGPLPSAAA